MTGGNEIAWVETPIDAFFAEIQGSTRIALAEGGTLAGLRQPERPPVPRDRSRAGRARRTHRRGSIDAGHPCLGRTPSRAPAGAAQREPELRVLSRGRAAAAGEPDAAIDGPPGSLGVPLLRERVIAADPRAIPPGGPGVHRHHRAGVDATTAPARADAGHRRRDPGCRPRHFFWGTGDAAGRLAGRMRQPGRLWLLWPKGVPLPKS